MRKKTEIESKETEKAQNQETLSVALGTGSIAVGSMGAMLGGIADNPLGSEIAEINIGLAAGAVGGGFAVQADDETVDASKEDAFWRERHSSEPYAIGTPYEDYAPAYRAGYEGYLRRGGEKFADVEENIREEYQSHRAGLPWEKARPASAAAWKRLRNRTQYPRRSPL